MLVDARGGSSYIGMFSSRCVDVPGGAVKVNSFNSWRALGTLRSNEHKRASKTH